VLATISDNQTDKQNRQKYGIQGPTGSVYAGYNDTTTEKGSTHVQENSNKSCRGFFPWVDGLF
jgi:hypothetical protein